MPGISLDVAHAIKQEEPELTLSSVLPVVVESAESVEKSTAETKETKEIPVTADTLLGLMSNG